MRLPLYLALAAGAAAKCRKNDQCADGQFCNVEKECEACYYPGDIGTENPACQRQCINQIVETRRFDGVVLWSITARSSHGRVFAEKGISEELSCTRLTA
jgi:hypothetical protein